MPDDVQQVLTKLKKLTASTKKIDFKQAEKKLDAAQKSVSEAKKLEAKSENAD